jgi:anti-anti-sigma regulatory factor
MATKTTLFHIDASDPGRSFADARATAEGQEPGSELLLDFGGVSRIDPAGVRSLQRLSAVTASRTVRLTARAVPIDVYKVLKLSGLAATITVR